MNIAKLLSDSQVDSVICATDAGREGELIFRLVYEKASCVVVKLTTISEALHYNRTYLGRKFKKETSYYFTDYLDKIRVEKAKKLLLHNYKVYQAAEMVGYHNVDYFNSKFKKYENITPSQYKKQHKKEE